MISCHFCDRPGQIRVKSEETNGDTDLAACDMHWDILKNPVTGLSFIRGITALSLRTLGRDLSTREKSQIDKYFKILESWKPSIKN